MIYVFEDGRIIYTEELLTHDDAGQYIEVETLPKIPTKKGKIGYLRADLATNQLVVEYTDKGAEIEPIEPIIEPQPIEPEPTLTELKELSMIQMSALAELVEMVLEGQK